MVGVDGGVLEGHGEAAGKVHHGTVDHVGHTEPEVRVGRAGDAVALTGPHVAELNAPSAMDGDLGTHGVGIGFDALEVEADPVVLVAVIGVQLVRVVVVRAHIDAAVAGDDVNLAIAAHITRCEAQHGIAVRERPGELLKGAVTIALEVVVGAVVPGGHEIQEAVVVEVFELAL